MVNPFIPLIQSYLPEPEVSLLTGMLFGKTPGFPKELYNALITTGTIHVVALSGMNISILTNLICKITFPLGRKLSSIISILMITGFIFFVGPSPTIIRAGIMGVLTMTAVYFGRQPFSLLSLFVAGAVMILMDPKVISNLSFQLSFLATLGILIFAPSARSIRFGQARKNLYLSIWVDIKNIFWENLRTTLAAQVATLPVIVFSFGRISLVSPLSNVLIGWTIFPIMVLGLIISIAGIIFLPFGQITAWFIYPLLWYFVKVVEVTAKLPFASLTLK